LSRRWQGQQAADHGRYQWKSHLHSSVHNQRQAECLLASGESAHGEITLHTEDQSALYR
jgi:hypothetical protein